MRIVNILTNILTAMVEDNDCTLASWQYNDKPTANIQLDRNMSDPTALLIQLTDWKLDWASGRIREKASINISFLQKEGKLDANGITQEAIITNMKNLAVDFIKRVNERKFSIRIVDDEITVKSIFLRSDSNRTGVNLQMEIEEVQGVCL